MYIFIDEAGIFKPRDSDKEVISTVGALVIPHDSYDSVIYQFKKLKVKWGVLGERKGSKLNEYQVDEVVQILETHNALFIPASVNSIFQKSEVIQLHKKGYQESMLQVPNRLHPDLVQKFKELGHFITALSDQLYVQYQVMNMLVYFAHQISTLYYVKSCPPELGQFVWVIDAKGKILTPAEEWWCDSLVFTFHNMGFISPFKMLRNADYSHYKKFMSDENSLSINVNKIMEELYFADSKIDEGLQLVDIVTTALNKALNNKFGILGWYRIGRIMMTQHWLPVLLLCFDEKGTFTNNDHLKFVVSKLRKASKRALV